MRNTAAIIITEILSSRIPRSILKSPTKGRFPRFTQVNSAEMLDPTSVESLNAAITRVNINPSSENLKPVSSLKLLSEKQGYGKAEQGKEKNCGSKLYIS